MNKEVKEKKILHKVKKNWVVIGMATVSLLGTGYVVSQGTDVAPTTVVAHADEQSSSYQADPNNVSATITNVDASTQNVTPGKSVNYEVSLNNSDNLGRVIPKGTKITFTVNPQSGKNFSDLFSSISAYTKYGNANVFDVSTNDNVVTLTTNTDLYPSDSKINVSLLVKEGPQDAPDSTYDATVSASMDYAGTTSNVPVSNGNISVLQKKKSDVKPVDSQAGQMGARPLNIPDKTKPNTPDNWNTYPDDVPDYPLSNTYKNLIQYSGDTANAGYAPIVTNKDGKPYFMVVAELNPNSKDNTVHGRAITLLNRNSDKSSFDTNNFRLYAIVDGKYKDITNEPGVYLKSEYGNPMFDYSASKYTDNTVDFVAYLTYNDLTTNYGVDGYLKYTVGDDPTVNNVPPMHASVSIVPASDNIGKSWIISPDTTVYTDKDGNYTYNSGALTNGVNVFQAVDGNPAKYVAVNNSQIKVANDDNVNDGQVINVSQQSTKDVNLTYSADGAVNSQAKLHVINPYVSFPDQQVTRNVKVNYVDSITGKVLKTDTGSSVFKATGVKDTRDNLITWGNWSNVSGDGTYNFTVPTIDGYVPEDSSNVSGTLAPLGNDVTRTVLMDPTEQVTSTNTVPVIAIPRDKTKTITTTGKVGTSTESAPIDGYQETKNVTFTRTGTKNQKTGNVTWGNFTPDSQTVSFTAPNIPGYYLISKSQKDHKVSAPLSDGPRVIYLSFLYKPMSDVTRTTKGNVTINYIDEETKQAIHDPYSKDLEFTQAGKKNDQTGETVWDDKGYTPASQSYSVDSPKIDGYELVNPSQSTVSGTISGGDDGIVDTVAYKKIETPSSSASDISAASSEASQSSSAASSSADSSSAESSASSHVVVPNSSTPSHGNNNGKPAADKHEASTPTVENHKNNGGTLSVENKATNTSANKEANRLLQTGDQTHENILVAIGAALIAMALGLVFFGSRRRRK
ncbi:LPXTG cell wall anchor domain-containing protein [Lactobacillus kunkeei]|uniref:KxYKxGKxW signal peptide domain-containing protein n=1 Tax=Apilactobacillus nanyangensis TaxID=2799579 RepID=A0ABT0HWG1_9LACO|nr:KxYKxGKxW signal peptide domain-containing protein [Apilactobacillus nanyangensis]MBC6388799.1 LPXTG cell wall anchor domain-containing protein [Apilactobacillus kunkeei]MCK8610961.1 KxYKxGKxW signal peptide domain-containing protein [Apilactobacillus nanyangensis]